MSSPILSCFFEAEGSREHPPHAVRVRKWKIKGNFLSKQIFCSFVTSEDIWLWILHFNICAFCFGCNFWRPCEPKGKVQTQIQIQKQKQAKTNSSQNSSQNQKQGKIQEKGRIHLLQIQKQKQRYATRSQTQELGQGSSKRKISNLPEPIPKRPKNHGTQVQKKSENVPNTRLNQILDQTPECIDRKIRLKGIQKISINDDGIPNGGESLLCKSLGWVPNKPSKNSNVLQFWKEFERHVILRYHFRDDLDSPDNGPKCKVKSSWLPDKIYPEVEKYLYNMKRHVTQKLDDNPPLILLNITWLLRDSSPSTSC